MYCSVRCREESAHKVPGNTLESNTVVLQEGLNYRLLHPPTVLGQNGAVKMRRPNQTSYEEETRVCCARGGRDGRDGLPGPPGPQGLAGVLGGEGWEGEELGGERRG